MASMALATAYYQLVASAPNAQKQITDAIVPAASKAGDAGGKTLGGKLREGLRGAAAPIAATLAAVGVGSFVKSSVGAFSDLAGSVNSLRRIAGGTAQEVSGLMGAMRLSGMDVESANTSLTIFAKKIQAASGDSGKLAELQNKLGVEVKRADGTLKSMGEILPDVSNKFKTMPDGIEKTALATELFGRNGVSMLPFLNQGAEGIDKLTQKANELGYVLDDEAIKKNAAFKAALRESQMAMMGAQIQIGAALIPAITAFTGAINKSIAPALKDLAVSLSNSGAVEAFANVVKTAIGTIQGLLSVVDPNVLIGFGGAILAASQAMRVIAPLLPLMRLGIQGINLALKANPLILVISLIATVIALFVGWVTSTKEGQEFLKATFEVIGNIFRGIGEVVSTVFGAISSFISDTFAVIGQVFSTGLEFFNSTFSVGFQAMSIVVSTVFGAISSFIDGTIQAISNVIGAVGGTIANIWGGIWNGVSAVFRGVWDGIMAVGNGISGFFQSIFNGVVNIIRGAVNGILSPINVIIDGINNLTGLASNVGINIPKVPRIPALATGGRILAEGYAMVGENGPEIVKLPKGSQVAPNGYGFGGGSSGNSFIVNANDPMLVARVVAEKLRRN